MSRSVPPDENEFLPKHFLIPALLLDWLHDPSMGNALIRFTLPGTQRTDEATPVFQRDVTFTLSVLNEVRSDSVVGEAEGEERKCYNTNLHPVSHHFQIIAD